MFAPHVDRDARAHAIREFPKESCGIVTGGEYMPIENVAEDPVADFKMPPNAFTAHGKVDAVIHGHRKSASSPSANDMVHQIATAVPWGIAQTDGIDASPVLWWGDFRLDEPLLGRQFVHGITDCYAAVRAWHWQRRKVRLIDIPRQDQWWGNGGDLYNDWFPRAGFRTIPESEAQIGDLALINFRSKVPNHSGTLVEDGLIFHHLQGRLSCREPIGRWGPLITKWLRHEG